MGIIRMLLAFAVFSHHTAILNKELLPGTDAVRLFFIMSGFYMALILSSSYGRTRLRVFYTNRLLRIFPAYILVAAASLVALALVDAHPFLSREELLEIIKATPEILGWMIPANLGIFGQDTLFFIDFDEGFRPVQLSGTDCAFLGFHLSLIPQAWSIAVELWFYLVAPLLVRLRSYQLLLLGLCSLGLHTWLSTTVVDGSNMAHHFFPAQLHLFILGLLSHRLCSLMLPLGKFWGYSTLAVLVAAILAYRAMADPWRYPLLATLLAFGMPAVFNAMRDVRWDRVIGELSYPFYLVQFLVISLCDTLLPQAPDIVALALAAFAALVLYLFVECPLARWRWKRLRIAQAHMPGLLAPASAKNGTASS